VPRRLGTTSDVFIGVRFPPTAYYHNSPFSLIHVPPEKWGGSCRSGICRNESDDVEYQVNSVKDTDSLFFLSDQSDTFSDLSLKIEMEDVGTGLRCVLESASLSSLPFASAKAQGFPLFRASAIRRGTARHGTARQRCDCIF